ncbi:peptide chain release factor 2 [uncultured Thomasclavelia sp.]|uniref:peptide chain release factor 2 n=1 Tax=uncultured Thomasclavelia sp. TaxID=3025759 RepID=UPI0025DAD234|nr:peptide chain release factor 2 [uncultured Thomasclavelia sp.]
MELYEIKNGLAKAHLLIEEFYQTIDIEGYRREIEGLTNVTLQEGFWDDANKAKGIYDKLNRMKKTVDQYDSLKQKLDELNETYELVKNTDDQEFQEILESDYLAFEQELSEFEKMMLLSGEHDNLNAIVEIHPGAGGTESQDWADMLFRMYQRYATRKGWKVEVLDYLDGDVAGIKSVTMLVKGEMAYGHLKAEKGVHRLVRLSPFDSAKRRHTSFASVDVMPEFNNEIEIEIQSSDLKIDTYRASGAGGQHINKTDSAVRITHIPTNIVVTCQSQRSQIQNREQAMIMLKSKLYQLMLEKQASQLQELKGEQKEIAWGSQIRSYVLHPYSLVKDNRSNFESNNPKAVLDGDLDDFIYAYLKTTM